MKVDPELEKMRYNLVPKQTTEFNFWRNYFYRVSLIRQASQLTEVEENPPVANEDETEKQKPVTTETVCDFNEKKKKKEKKKIIQK